MFTRSKKSETSYSISKAYGITVEQINHENPPAVYGMKEGQTLRIPVNGDSESLKSQHLLKRSMMIQNLFIIA